LCEGGLKAAQAKCTYEPQNFKLNPPSKRLTRWYGLLDWTGLDWTGMVLVHNEATTICCRLCDNECSYHPFATSFIGLCY
jgi:hypothetical protein